MSKFEIQLFGNHEYDKAKGYFYLGKSKDQYKIGYTFNLENRFTYYQKQHQDFKYLKHWEVKNPKHLESYFMESNYKEKLFLARGEWFTSKLIDEQVIELVSIDIEYLINNTGIKISTKFYPMYKIT